MVMQAVAQVLNFYLFNELRTDAERTLRDRVRHVCDKKVIPSINPYCERA